MMAPNVSRLSSLSLLVLSAITPALAGPAIYRRAAVDVGSLPTGWTYEGCYVDATGARTLGSSTYTSYTAMTEGACATYCGTKGFKYAGVEYGQECWCGNALTADVGTEASCSMPCSGDATQLCGGPNRLNVFSSSSVTGPIVNPGPGAWGSMGCYSDVSATRTLRNQVQLSGATTITLCVNACAAQNYKYAGAEYGGECYCDNSFANGGGPAPDGAAQCNMPCNGNATELCGGPNRLNVYGLNYPKPGASSTPVTPATSSTKAPVSTPPASTPPASTPPASSSPASSSAATYAAGWTAQGCYTDSVAARSLPYGAAVPGGGDAMTIDLCLAACKASGYTIAGVEYASQCYCGNAFANNGAPAPDGSAQCNMPCSGNAAQTCGGPDRLNVFFYAAGTAGTSSTNPPSTPTTTPTAVAPTTTPPTNTQVVGGGTATNLPAGWTYRGCWVDSLNGRIMTGPFANAATVTIESCIQTCIAGGYKVAGLQYSQQCFCDNQLRNNATLAATDGTCAMKCAGAPSEICGGPDLDSVYATGELTVIAPASSQTTGLPGNWVYKGCLTDTGNPHTLAEQIIYTTTNQASACLAQCAAFGYNAAGMEYGQECYCGDKGDKGANNATFVADAQCNQACPGNARYMCGAGNLLSYYEWQGTPLQTYGYPAGAQAGEFVLMGNAPVIALITTQGTNGKVTFVEKSGTSTTPGSTGAYEYDISTNTYRTMHVKTDVFCSAGLVLPDKVGRQINIGGWSGDSTYGIRLYWPDGAPGVASTNDWQENFQELALQNGRWYPTAMIMANGSILVVGGEDGSNGPPVPTLELLPRAGGTLYMEWLERTDPYNLYPFMAVLPSGGIFVAYYNEAIILDEVTFATSKTLPNMPGAVNNPAGGRTYPLEGTMVLMPQYPPYTDPLGVLICGGSTPYGGFAIDNCVSTTPESANPVWTIEKMPSKRVMSCMTALPDGTYLILNGAHVGVAGFGLASDPNHNAVLYDPTKPVNARMSLMANTTIDRFYHSEAILLQDGRVLVTGSDPETEGLIQETRVEVFVPPYLKTGVAQPSFTITNSDWTYGAKITIAVTLPGGGPARFSLMGAESSTHGNSMGQRTIFPAVTCAGTSCTLTAPPNAHVCPPGWFQLFLLDGAVPSRSQYVRIGGDPADLGAWPVEPDFTIPGSG